MNRKFDKAAELWEMRQDEVFDRRGAEAVLSDAVISPDSRSLYYRLTLTSLVTLRKRLGMSRNESPTF